MESDSKIPEPLLFNPLKHYLPYIRDLIESSISGKSPYDPKELVRMIRHIGNCVMDIYTGNLSRERIFQEVKSFLDSSGLNDMGKYRHWVGPRFTDYKIIVLSDSSRWTMKYQNNEAHYVHIFPARSSPHTFRIKANTLKSAILYMIIIGKDFITEDDLNRARALAGLSPVREVADTEAVTELIEILRK